VFLGILFLLGLFVTVFAEIHEPADRRRGGGGDLKTRSTLSCRARLIASFSEMNTEFVLPSNSNDPDFAGADFAVDPDNEAGE